MEHTIIVKRDGTEYTAICYEMPSLQASDSQIEDAVLQLVDLIEEELAYGEIPEPLEFSEALQTVGL